MKLSEDDEIQKCKDAMSKPAPMAALRLIASGRATIEVLGNEIKLDTLDGRPVRATPSGRISRAGKGCKMGIAGSWPLVRAGMVDQFGCVTPAGRLALESET